MYITKCIIYRLTSTFPNCDLPHSPHPFGKIHLILMKLLKSEILNEVFWPWNRKFLLYLFRRVKSELHLLFFWKIEYYCDGFLENALPINFSDETLSMSLTSFLLFLILICSVLPPSFLLEEKNIFKLLFPLSIVV